MSTMRAFTLLLSEEKNGCLKEITKCSLTEGNVGVMALIAKSEKPSFKKSGSVAVFTRRWSSAKWVSSRSVPAISVSSEEGRICLVQNMGISLI